MENISIPIKFRDSYEGFAESSGILSLRENHIIIQFETKDALFGLIKSGLKKVAIPLKHIEELAYKKSIFGNRVSIKVDDLSYLEDLPERSNNKVVLLIDRKNIDRAIDLIRAIRLDMSEKEYQQALANA